MTNKETLIRSHTEPNPSPAPFSTRQGLGILIGGVLGGLAVMELEATNTAAYEANFKTRLGRGRFITKVIVGMGLGALAGKYIAENSES